MSDTIRWGILGAGRIAGKFAEGLKAAAGAELAAVGSRSAEKAEAFAGKYGMARAHGAYEALAADPDVDVVYVATPHPFHRDNAVLCLEHGKAVLCEKPMEINAARAREMIEAAQAKNLFLMEAMWTHAFPAMAKVRELVAEGAIGDVRMVKADFCFRGGDDPATRTLNPDLGGGGLLDVGVYVTAFAHTVFNEDPLTIASVPHLGETGVDEQAGIVLGYKGGALAVLTCAVRTSTPQTALIAGTEGRIEVPHMFWQPDRIVVCKGKEREELDFERLGNGYTFEAVEVMRCLREGRTESEIVPFQRTLSVLGTLDRIRAQWGLVYPME